MQRGTSAGDGNSRTAQGPSVRASMSATLRRALMPLAGLAAAPSARAVIATGLLSCLAMALLVGAMVARERQATLQRATRTTAAMTLVLEQHTARTFQAVDLTLAGIADALALAPNLPRHDPAFRATLGKRLQELGPYVRAIFVIGADGRILHDTDYPNTPDVSLADRDYFRNHAANLQLERSMSAPLQSRSGMGWFVAVTRRIGDGSRFGGIAVAAMQPQYFEGIYRDMGLGERDIVTLYHRDGVLVARYPPDAVAVGKSFARSPIFTSHLPQALTGTYVTDTGVLDFERIVSYRALDEWPLVVVLAQGTDSLLAAWRHSAAGALIALVGVMALLAVIIAQIVRQQQARERARQRLAQAEKLEALGQLTGGIAHDFANLLGIIGSNLEILARTGVADERGKQAMAMARRTLRRGAELTNRLLSFARRRTVKVVPADLNALVNDARDLVRQALGSGIAVELALAPDLPRCLVDPSEFEVALVNLAVNCTRCHGWRRSARADHHAGTRDAVAGADGARAGLRCAVGARHRARHDAGSAPPGDGAVLHHQGRDGHGSRARPGRRVDAATRRRSGDRIGAGQGHDGPSFLSPCERWRHTRGRQHPGVVNRA